MSLSRRELFMNAAGAASLLAVGVRSSAAKDFPAVPTDWDAQGMYENYRDKGQGVTFAGPAGRPAAYIAFDPQCKWCIGLMKQCAALTGRVDFHWMPVALLSVHSEPQGALILAAADRARALREHEAHFMDKDFRGLVYEGRTLPRPMRDAVWENSKIFRRTACRVVPFGVMKDAAGQYRAITFDMKTAEIAKLFGFDS